MSEIRQSSMTKDWVIIASKRAKRPGDFKVQELTWPFIEPNMGRRVRNKRNGRR